MVLLDSDNATIFSVTSTVSTFLVSLTYVILCLCRDLNRIYFYIVIWI